MTTRDELIAAIADALGEHRVSTERIGDTLNATLGKGLMASKANLDLAPVLEHLEGVAPEALPRQIAGFASGVRAVMLEPKRSKASQWTYEETAGRMLPNLEVDTFVLGAEAAGQETPWHARFSDELLLTVYIQLDRGLRLVTLPQMERWGATDDRIYSAARSMLFHRTRDAQLAPHEDLAHVRRVRVGDGYDAVRSIVLTDVFFADLDESSFRFSAPHQDLLLYVQGDDEERLAQLREATRRAFEGADYPLSDAIYSLEAGRPITARRL